jgi:hypothetical protein
MVCASLYHSLNAAKHGQQSMGQQSMHGTAEHALLPEQSIAETHALVRIGSRVIPES